MTTIDTDIGFAKPPLLRVIFILNALKIFLALGLLIGFKYYDLQVGTVGGPSAVTLIFWTMIGYIVTFAAIVASIVKRSIIGLRAAIVTDFLISFPAKAFVGFAVALIGLGLSFTQPVKAYFAWRPK
ncbi:hypothetical protein [Ruegeria sp. HKCCA5426]|uniref:hypothetical protein n=1 Tax=Ruegeria sp. HKCCA5426 TaxID=2682985 RepID=UPI001487B610|nr:hypothetical protein [Ruegeria sp. HKCCA5426]